MQVPDLLVGVIQRFLVTQVGLSHPKIMVGMGPQVEKSQAGC